MTKRTKLTLKTKLASALCQMLRPNTVGGYERIISHEDAKRMSEDQILAVFDWDHFPIPKAHDGPDEHWNLTPTPRPEHRTKTAKHDVPMIAKVRRLSQDQEDFRRKVLERPTGQKRQRTGKINSRAWDEWRTPHPDNVKKSKIKIKSRPSWPKRSFR
jgi:hypothetical protein